jgi:hypothetical protein
MSLIMAGAFAKRGFELTEYGRAMDRAFFRFGPCLHARAVCEPLLTPVSTGNSDVALRGVFTRVGGIARRIEAMRPQRVKGWPTHAPSPAAARGSGSTRSANPLTLAIP